MCPINLSCLEKRLNSCICMLDGVPPFQLQYSFNVFRASNVIHLLGFPFFSILNRKRPLNVLSRNHLPWGSCFERTRSRAPSILLSQTPNPVRIPSISRASVFHIRGNPNFSQDSFATEDMSWLFLKM